MGCTRQPWALLDSPAQCGRGRGAFGCRNLRWCTPQGRALLFPALRLFVRTLSLIPSLIRIPLLVDVQHLVFWDVCLRSVIL